MSRGSPSDPFVLHRCYLYSTVQLKDTFLDGLDLTSLQGRHHSTQCPLSGSGPNFLSTTSLANSHLVWLHCLSSLRATSSGTKQYSFEVLGLRQTMEVVKGEILDSATVKEMESQRWLVLRSGESLSLPECF
jgi:hypothetical protein